MRLPVAAEIGVLAGIRLQLSGREHFDDDLGDRRIELGAGTAIELADDHILRERLLVDALGSI